MTEDIPIVGIDGAPVYTIKTVVHETGISPATLRAWERRYGVLSPGRSNGGYRLYSERDIVTLRWLKHQVETGVSISRAVALLEMRRRVGDEPELAIPRPGRRDHVDPITASLGARSHASLAADLIEALLAFQEERAEHILTEAFTLYPVEVVTEEVVAPTLIEIGERWHRGDASVVQEHFATAFLRRRLTALLQAYNQPQAGKLAVTGSAPAEWHDVGILLVSLALRRRGWRVISLGQNVPVEQLLDEVRRLKPDLLCLSAATRESAAALAEVYSAVHSWPEPRPRLMFGGRAFNAFPELKDQYPGAFGGSTASELLGRISFH